MLTLFHVQIVLPSQIWLWYDFVVIKFMSPCNKVYASCFLFLC